MPGTTKTRFLLVSIGVLLTLISFLLLGRRQGSGPMPPPQEFVSTQDVRAPPPLPETDSSCIEPRGHAPVSSPPSPPQEQNTIDIVVRDLVDGSSVPGMRLALIAAEDGLDEVTSVVVANEEGVARIPGVGVRRVVPSSPGWESPASREGEMWKGGELWVYRMMLVDVAVRGFDGVRDLNPGAVRLRVFGQGTGDSPWTRDWLELHDLGKLPAVGPLDSNGRTKLELPRIRGLQICASAPGMRPATEEIPIPANGEESAVVNLELGLQSIPIRGTLTGSNGEPANNTLVTAYIVVETTKGDLDRAKIRGAGHAWTLSVSSKTGRAVITYYVCGNTDENGAFDLGSNVKGEVTLVSFPPGEDRPVFERLGALPDDGVEADLTATAGKLGERIQFVQGGRPLKDVEVTISNLTLAPPQAAFSEKLDSSGRMPTSWLTRGHRYTFTSRPKTRPLEFVWNGEKTLDVDVLWTRMMEPKTSDSED